MIDTRYYHVHGPFSLGDLLAGTSIEIPDPKFLDEEIAAPAPLAGSKPGHISFLINKAYRKDLETAKATACFVSEKLALSVGEAHILPLITHHPRTAFAKIMTKFATPKLWDNEGEGADIAKSARVHPSAVISPATVIGENVHIGPGSCIGPGVRIGVGTHIGANVTIQAAEIGKNCRIKSSTVIGSEGFAADTDGTNLLTLPHIGRVIIGNDVFIGSQTCVDRGFLGDTIIEDQVKIDNLVQIAHNVFIGAGTILAGRAGISGSCHIGKNVRMGGSVGLADHLTIGDGAQIAASSGLMKDVPAGEVWGGTPAMPLRDMMRIIAAQRKLIKK